MKKFLRLICACLLFTAVINAQNLNSFVVNCTLNQFLSINLKFTNDAIYFISNDNTLIKTDYDGNLLWSKMLDTSLYLNGGWGATENSVYLSSGSRWSRIDSSGNIMWTKDVTNFFCTPSNIGIRVVTNEKIYGCGGDYINGPESWIILDSSGTFINAWCNTHPFTDYSWHSFPSLNTGFWIIFLIGPGNGYDEAIVKTDSIGNIDLSSNYLNMDYGVEESVEGIIPLCDSDYVAISNISYPIILPGSMSVTKFREDGTTIWKKVFESQSDTSFQIIRAGTDSSNNIYILATARNDIPESFYFSLKLDSSGNTLFAKKWLNMSPLITLYGASEQMKYYHGHLACPAAFTNNGQNNPVILYFDTLWNFSCGITDTSFSLSQHFIPVTYSTWHSNYNYSFIPSDTILANPVLTNSTSGILCSLLEVPKQIKNAIFQVSPNPASQVIKIEMKSTDAFKLDIYDLTGEKIYSTDISGLKTVEINCENFVQGFYFLNVFYDNGERSVSKIVVLK